jgi:hypothetical protein
MAKWYDMVGLASMTSCGNRGRISHLFDSNKSDCRVFEPPPWPRLSLSLLQSNSVFSDNGKLLPLYVRTLRTGFDERKWMIGIGKHLSGSLVELNPDDR